MREAIGTATPTGGGEADIELVCDLPPRHITVNGKRYVPESPEPARLPDIADQYVDGCMNSEACYQFTPCRVKRLIRNSIRETVKMADRSFDGGVMSDDYAKGMAEFKRAVLMQVSG